MKKNKKSKSRRSFLGFSRTQEGGSTEEAKMVKMLSPDGQLVWVKPSAIKKNTSVKTSHKEILDWSKAIHKKNDKL